MLILQHFVEKKRTRPHCFKINMEKIKSAFYIEIKKNLVINNQISHFISIKFAVAMVTRNMWPK